MTLPNFLIIGAGKAGTTSLYEYLRQHPQIFMPTVKEPRYFALADQPPFRGPGDERVNRRGVWTWDEYVALFDAAGDARAVGEASPMYLYVEHAAPRISQTLPDAKLIAILRDPAERAWSHYLMNRLWGVETLSLLEAIEAEPRRRQQHWSWSNYMLQGLYHRHLTRFLQYFPRERLHICLFEDFRTNPAAVCRELFAFLDVEDSFTPDVTQMHQFTGVPRRRWLSAVIDRPHALKAAVRPWVPKAVRAGVRRLRRWNLQREQMTRDQRAALIEQFRDDTVALESLLRRDLSRWREI